MADLNLTPSASELPSSRSLMRSTLIAAAVAAVLLVVVVMPAEYGVDPTRVGRMLGLTQMGEIKMTLAKEAAAADSAEAVARAASATGGVGGQAAPVPAAAQTPAAQTPAAQTPVAQVAPPASSAAAVNDHVTEVVLRPNEGKEIKLVMRKDARVTFSWSTDRGVVNYDTHADAPGIKYHGYEKGSAVPKQEGVLVAAFDGSHGWFWRNRGREVVTVTLRTNGDYQELKRM